MKRQWTLAACFIAIFAVIGLIRGFVSHGWPHWLPNLLFGVFTFSWVSVDAKMNNSKLSPWVGALAIFLWPIGFLVYAFRTRTATAAWILIGKGLLCFVATVVSFFLGVSLGRLLS